MLILTSLYMSLWCVAAYELQDGGQLLHFIKRPFQWWVKKIDAGKSVAHRKIYTLTSKPITSCVICFASFWGSMPYFYFGGTLSLDWLFCTIVCSLFNYIIYCLVRILEKI